MKVYSSSAATPPIREQELHAYADNLLTDARSLEVEAYLASHPDQAAQVAAWQAQNEQLRGLYADVADEPIPARLPLAPSRNTVFFSRFSYFAMAASIALVSGSAGWLMHSKLGDSSPQFMAAARSATTDKSGLQNVTNIARHAAVAHAVYTPEVRRPVEVGAEQEDQLVTWLSKRLGEPLKPPKLQELGFELVGGRLLPGEVGPVAQLMYQDGSGARLTLYVTHEVKGEQPKIAENRDTAFQFSQEGAVGVFYWVDRDFGYAISGSIDKAALSRVATVVYRQLGR